MESRPQVVEQYINETESRAKCRTRWEGQDEFADEAAVAYIRDLESQLSRQWISVEERLPEPDRPVLAFDGHFRCLRICWYSRKRWSEPGNIATTPVTHWQPLPKGPSNE